MGQIQVFCAVLALGLLVNAAPVLSESILKPGAAPNGDIIEGLSPIMREKWKPFRPSGMELVDSPVRSGEQALRVELHAGDCGVEPSGWNDCKHGNERVELLSGRRWSEGSEVEVGWSMYIPNGFPSARWNGQKRPEMFLGQFHGINTGQLFAFFYGGWEPGSGGLNVKGPDGSKDFHGPFRSTVIPRSELFERGNDIVVRVRWTSEANGYFSVWRNGKSIGDYRGPTLPNSKEKAYLKLGIYRLDTRPDAGVAVVYYDNVYSKGIETN